MEIKIVKEKENPFFKRKDLNVEIKHDGVSTPKTDDVVKELAAKFSVDETQVVIDYIMTKSGLSESNARVKILNEKPPKIEKPEEKKTEQKPKEEVKEETKEEDVKNEAQTPESK